MNSLPSNGAGAHEAIEARAAAWLAQRDDNGLSIAEARAFADWRAADPRHEAAVERLEATWNSLQQLGTFRPESRQHPDRDLLSSSRRPQRRPWSRPVLGFATALVLVAAIIAVKRWHVIPGLIQTPGEAAVTDHYATTAHGFQRAILPDGSIIELNEDTSIATRFTPEERRIELINGEIHCTVAKNAARPFNVVANGVTVRAVGTAFDVRMAPGTVEVLVTEGRISLRDAAAHPASPPMVSAGERAVVVFDGRSPRLTINHLSAAAIADALAWQGSRLVFAETPLSEVVAQFNRRNKLKIEVADPSIGQLQVDGSFQADNVEALVRLIANKPGIQVERPSPDLLILRRAH